MFVIQSQSVSYRGKRWSTIPGARYATRDEAIKALPELRRLLGYNDSNVKTRIIQQP